MKTITKSIYIGLGEAGVSSVAYARKQYEAMFGVGEIPPQVAFIEENVLEEETLDKVIVAMKHAMFTVTAPAPLVADYSVSNFHPVDVRLVGALSEDGQLLIKVANSLRRLYSSDIRLVGYGLNNAETIEDRKSVRDCMVEIEHEQSIYDLFDYFYLAENKRSGAYPMVSPMTLYETVGMCMFYHSTIMYDKIGSILDNRSWRFGNFDEGEKPGWIHTMGLSHLIYDSEKLVKLFCIKASQQIVRSLLTSSDCDVDAQAWMQSVSIVNVNESAAFLESISPIHSPKPLDFQGFRRPDRLRCEFSDYVDNVYSVLERNNATNVKAVWSRHLEWMLADLVRSEGGLAKSVDFLQGVMVACEDVLCSLRARIEEQNKHVKAELHKANNALEEYISVMQKVLVMKSRKADALHNVVGYADRLLRLKAESERMKVAETLLSEFSVEVEGHFSRLDSMAACLMLQLNEDETTAKQLIKHQSDSTLELDLSVFDAAQMPTVFEEVNLGDFIQSFDSSILYMSPSTILNSIMDYVKGLPRCDFYRSRLITDVVNELNESSFADIMRELSERTQPLIGRSFSMPDRLMDVSCAASYMTTEDNPCRLMNDHYYEWIAHDNPFLKQKMVFYRSVFAYQLDSLVF